MTSVISMSLHVISQCLFPPVHLAVVPRVPSGNSMKHNAPRSAIASALARRGHLWRLRPSPPAPAIRRTAARSLYLLQQIPDSEHGRGQSMRATDGVATWTHVLGSEPAAQLPASTPIARLEQAGCHPSVGWTCPRGTSGSACRWRPRVARLNRDRTVRRGLIC